MSVVSLTLFSPEGFNFTYHGEGVYKQIHYYADATYLSYRKQG